MLWSITHRFQCLSSSDGQVAHALRTLPPVAARVLLPRAAPRLACVKPAASVHPEPGSNSSLYIFYFPGLVQFLRIDALDLCLFGTCFLYFPSVFSMISLNPAPWGWAVKNPAHFVKRDCKGTHFFDSCKLFSNFFYKNSNFIVLLLHHSTGGHSGSCRSGLRNVYNATFRGKEHTCY